MCSGNSGEQYWQPPLFEIEQLGKVALLGRIELISVEIQQRQLDLIETVAGARAAGATWREIGEANATSAQAAQQRFGHSNGART